MNARLTGIDCGLLPSQAERMIYRMGRGRPIVFLVTLIALAVASPVGAQSYDESGAAVDNGAPPPDDSGWFDPNEQAAPPPDAPATAPQANTAPSEPAPDDADPRALTDFRPSLDPYGTWAQDPVYGTVWIPARQVVGDNFSPYVSGGHWALSTNNEWVWVSDYPFGSVVYHYGRWVYISGTGWAWIPGYRYAPAWVSFRVPTGSYAYVGWAPLPPDYVWFNGVAVGFYATPSYYWVFCPSAYAFHSHVNYYVVRDRAFVGRLAYYSRPYHYHSSAPRYRVPASPTPRMARVPARAVPHERVPLRPSPHVRAGARAYAGATVGPARTRADVTRIAPGTSERRAATVAPSRRPEVGRNEIGDVVRPSSPVVGDRGPSRNVPSTRSVGPARPQTPVRAVTPSRPSTPARSVEAARPPVRSLAPSTRSVAPSVRTVTPPVRSVAPSTRSVAPSVRTVAPSTRSVAPPVRSVAPSTRSVAPPVRTVAPSTRSVAPPVRTVAPPVRSVAPSRSMAPTRMRSVSPARTMSPAGHRSSRH